MSGAEGSRYLSDSLSTSWPGESLPLVRNLSIGDCRRARDGYRCSPWSGNRAASIRRSSFLGVGTEGEEKSVRALRGQKRRQKRAHYSDVLRAARKSGKGISLEQKLCSSLSRLELVGPHFNPHVDRPSAQDTKEAFSASVNVPGQSDLVLSNQRTRGETHRLSNLPVSTGPNDSEIPRLRIYGERNFSLAQR